MQEDTLPFTDEALQASLESLAELGKIKIEMSLGGTDIYLRSIYELEQTAAENIERVWLGEKRAVTS